MFCDLKRLRCQGASDSFVLLLVRGSCLCIFVITIIRAGEAAPVTAELARADIRAQRCTASSPKLQWTTARGLQEQLCCLGFSASENASNASRRRWRCSRTLHLRQGYDINRTTVLTKPS